MHFERHLPFKMHEVIFFPEKLKKNLGFTSEFRYVQVTLNTGIFLFGITTNYWYMSLGLDYKYLQYSL